MISDKRKKKKKKNLLRLASREIYASIIIFIFEICLVSFSYISFANANGRFVHILCRNEQDIHVKDNETKHFSRLVNCRIPINFIHLIGRRLPL